MAVERPTDTSTVRMEPGRRITHQRMTPGQRDRYNTARYSLVHTGIESNFRRDISPQKSDNSRPHKSGHRARLFMVGDVIDPREGFRLAYRSAHIFPKSKPQQAAAT